MTPEFADLVNPTFHYVLNLVDRIERDEPVSLERERQSIRNELEDADVTAANPDYPVRVEEFRLAKQALIYWVDEVMIEADRDWQDYLLEREYFDSRDAAWKFYVDGELRARRSSPDVIETWYLALVLGFQGDIKDAFKSHLNQPLPGGTNDEHEARAAWAADLARQIRQTQIPDLHGEPFRGDVSPLHGKAVLQVGAACLGLSVLAFCVLLYFWLRSA